MRLSILQLVELCVHLLLLSSNLFALCFLVSTIFSYESKSAIHLGKVLCREDKHQLVLYRVMFSQIAHRLYVFRLTFVQLLFESIQLRCQHIDITIYMCNVLLDICYLLLSIFDFAIYHQQILQSVLNVSLICP